MNTEMQARQELMAEKEGLSELLIAEIGMRNELVWAIKDLHKARGKYHTQQALEKLFALVGLKNNIGEHDEPS